MQTISPKVSVRIAPRSITITQGNQRLLRQFLTVLLRSLSTGCI